MGRDLVAKKAGSNGSRLKPGQSGPFPVRRSDWLVSMSDRLVSVSDCLVRWRAAEATAGRSIRLRAIHAPRPLQLEGSGFRVQGSEFRVQGSGFRVQGSGSKV
jgi:hypothetical protein